MALLLHDIALVAFAVLMAAAAVEDFRRLIIPNALSLGLGLMWPLYLVAAPSLTGALAAVGCALAVFVVGALCFSRGYIGGGDVKLLSVATLWAGPAATPALLAVTGLLGGVLALILLTPPGLQMWLAARAMLAPGKARSAAGEAGKDAVAPSPLQVPYGIAIAAAALIITLPPNFS